MSRLLVLVLSALLCFPLQSQSANPQAIRERFSKVKPGTTLKIRLDSNEKVNGKLISADESGIQISPRGGQTTRTIPYSEIKEYSTGMPTWGKALIITGAALGVIGVLAAVALAHQQ